MDKLLEEMKSYRKEFLEDMLFGQETVYEKKFINKFCMRCRRHRIIELENNQYHICNDTYSGDWYAGEHVLYSETIDMCMLNGGFIGK